MKEILNYSQIIAIILAINFKWPTYVMSYFQIPSFLGSLSNNTISLNCLIYDFNINESVVHLKFLMFALMPFLAWIILVFIHFLKARIKNQKISLEKLFAYLIIIGNYLQPLILQNIFDNLKCEKLNQKSFLAKDMNLECDSENHKNWVYTFVIKFLNSQLIIDLLFGHSFSDILGICLSIIMPFIFNKNEIF